MKTVKLVLIALSCAILSLSHVASAETAAQKTVRKKLKTIIIPKISFEDVPVSTAFAYLKRIARQQDPDGGGVNFMLILKPKKKIAREVKRVEKEEEEIWGEEEEKEKDGEEEEEDTQANLEPTISLDMDNLPLGEAIRFICMQAGLNHVVEDHAVVVMDKRMTRKRMELRVFSVDPRLLRDVKDVQKFFEERGVTFPTSTQ